MRKRRTNRTILAALAIPLALSGCTTKAGPLPEDWWQAYPEEDCSFSREFLPSIQSETYYEGNRNGAVDADAQASAMRASRPVRQLLARQLETDAQIKAGNAQSIVCAQRELAFWARNDALLGNNSMRGFYERLWYGAGLGIAYLHNDRLLADIGQPRPAQSREEIAGWFSRLGHDTRRAMAADYASFDDSRQTQSYRPPDEHDTSNLGAWAAYFTVIAGILSDDPELIAWGRGRTQDILATVTRDGMLPSEVKRGERALRYHFFALNPLAGSAIMLERVGEPLPKRSIERLQALVGFSLRESRNPEAIRYAAGVWSVENPLETGAWKRLMLGPALFCRHINPQSAECGLVPREDALEFPYMGGSTKQWAVRRSR